MRTITGRAFPRALVLAVLTASPALASFHLMQIEQVIGGVNGDTTAQAIQLRMRFLGQNLLAPSRIRAFDANGMNPVTIVDFTSSVPNGAAGARVLIASAAFVTKTTPATSPDFMMANLIPASYLAAGSLTFETDLGTTIYWRLSWGGAAYTGSGAGAIDNDSNGNFNPPFPSALPTTSNRALVFPGVASAGSTNNAADYAVTTAAAVFRNNATTSYTVNGCTVTGCDDSRSCTTDTCGFGEICNFAPNHAACEDGVFCNGPALCDPLAGDPTTGCRQGGNPCSAGQFCNETTDTCDQCQNNSDCNDSVACTDDACAGGVCVFTPNNANCPDDGVFCNGSEVCDPVLNCVSSGDPCGASETCNEVDDTCDSAPIRIRLDRVDLPGPSTRFVPLRSPLMLTHSGDGTDRLFVVDQVGQIRIIENGVLLDTPFLDISAKLPVLNPTFDERGLLGLAFHPDYANNGRLFVRYSAPRVGNPGDPCLTDFDGQCHKEVLAEYQVSAGDPNVADAGSELILLSVDKPQFNHNGGHLAFGPDGDLYVSLGDGGGAHDGLADVPPSHGPDGNGQNINTLLGKVLRIDVNGGSPYAIPPDNPFAGATPGLDEIYAYGLRNPYRFSFDRGTGDLFLGDAGQDLFEEVDRVVLGGNYGWVIREGFHCFDPFNPATPPASCAGTGAMGEPLLDPVSEYTHSEGGLAVVGGFVYRGVENPGLTSLYVYGDFSADFGPTGRLYYFETTGVNAYVRNEFIIDPSGEPFQKILKGFGEDEDGEIYVCASDDLGPLGMRGASGVVYRIHQCGCENPPATAPAPHNRAKNRYLSFDPNNGTRQVAFKVSRTFPAFGDLGWVDVPDANGMAQIVSAPVVRTWTEPVVHAGDCQIHPVPETVAAPLACSISGAPCGSLCGGGACPAGQGECVPPPTTYEIAATENGLTFSAPLTVTTVPRPCPKRWGDAVGDFSAGQWTAPNGTVNVNDFLAALQKFQVLPTAPHVTVVDVVGAGVLGQEACLNRSGNIGDVFNLIKAFQGAAYPFTTDPGSCPVCP
ncbi:MAG: PQQ-dependent sugar dehydrogenase [Planctomycetes bacterium]|nr:PQQ-dependent sugar dehydrogenase [Planctomycetota bacterium]